MSLINISHKFSVYFSVTHVPIYVLSDVYFSNNREYLYVMYRDGLKCGDRSRNIIPGRPKDTDLAKPLAGAVTMFVDVRHEKIASLIMRVSLSASPNY